jgi:hypothetical protein
MNAREVSHLEKKMIRLTIIEEVVNKASLNLVFKGFWPKASPLFANLL